jgi:hypothetical protein
MTEHIIPPMWLAGIDAMYREMLGLPPDTRTEAEKEHDRAVWAEESTRIRLGILAAHAQALAAADGLRRAVLELHAPVFSGDSDRYPNCEGCEYGGYEGEPTSFPCMTYDLARDFPT